MRIKEGFDKTALTSVPELFAGATLEANHAGKLRYELPLGTISLASVFETMEERKEELGILDYSASQPSLESIFLAIAEKDINRAPARRAAAAASVSPRLDSSSAHDHGAHSSAPGSSVLA